MPKTLHLAKWLVPITSPVIEDGAVLVDGSIIKAIGKKKELLPLIDSTATKIIDHHESVLMPGLINCHCHLELSWLRGKIEEGLGFVPWLMNVMSHIQNAKEINEEERLKAIQKAVEILTKDGVVLVADISNAPYDLNKINLTPEGCQLFIFIFVEILHPFKGVPQLQDLELKNKGFFAWSYSPHSLYTCSLKTVAKIKEFATSRSSSMPLHFLESEEEVEFLTKATGPFLEVFKRKKRIIEDFFSRFNRPIAEVLLKHGILDERTILVHCTFLDANELEIITKNGTSICLCPRSNWFIHGHLPDVQMIFDKTDCVCLGTDSLASNWDLSIFSEIRFLYDKFHGLSPFELLKAATINGARALGLDSEFGSVTPGKRSAIICIPNCPVSEKDLYDFLCTKAEKAGVQHVGAHIGDEK